MNEQDVNKSVTADEGSKIAENTNAEWKEAENKISDVTQGNRNLPNKLQQLHQNGTSQPLEPPTAVAAVTVTSSNLTVGLSSSPSTKTSNPLPSSTSPAGGVPFPQSLLHQQEHFSPSSIKTTVDHQVLPSKQTYGSSHYRDSDNVEVVDQPHHNDIAKSKLSLACNNVWQGRYDTFDKNVSKADFINGPRPNDNLNTIEDKKNGQRHSHDPYVSQVHPYLSNKYIQDDGSVIKQRNYYPKERTYDFLKKSESQRKYSSSKSQSVYHYPRDKSTCEYSKVQPYSTSYSGQSHPHSKHKIVDRSDRSNFNKCTDIRPNSLTNPYKISKDSRKSELGVDIHKNHTVGRSSEIITTSNSEGFTRYSKHSSQDALANVSNSVIRDKWTDPYYRGYHSSKNDNWVNSNHQSVISESKYVDNTKYNTRENFLPPSYKKWSEGTSKESDNHHLLQRYSKGELEKRSIKNYNSLNQEDAKYVNWNHSSGYLHHKGYVLDDNKYHSEYKYNHTKSSKHDFVPKPNDEFQNFDKKLRSDNFVNNIQFSSNPSLPENSSISKSENFTEFPLNNELPNSFDTADGSSSSSVNRSFSYLSVTKPSCETASALPLPTTSSPSPAAATSESGFPVNSYTNNYQSSTDSLKLSWSAANPTTSLLNSTTNTHPDVNVEIPVRDSIRSSSHGSSNGSVSSLSQQSHVLISSSDQGNNQIKDKVRERTSSGSSASNRSRSNSRNDIPSVGSAVSSSLYTPTTTNPALPTSSSTTFESSGSLTSLVFSKPSWNSSGSSASFTTGNQQLTTTSQASSSPLPLSGVQQSGSSTLGLSSQLQSPQLATGTSSYYPGGSQVMFAPSLVPTGSYLSAGLQTGGPSSAATAAQSAVYGGEALYPPSSQDLLRRELDTRFLASHDRSINIPPPPYMRTEMHQHQHQHTHMHQHSPFLPPPLGAQLMPQAAAHMYDKFPKLDSPFYGRSSIGIHGYPSLSPFLAPGATPAATPFGPPGALAAFQPKANSIIKTKNIKPGRWCAMHVRIAWEIYHHQQKQQQVDPHKGSSGSVASLTAASKSPTELLHPSNAIFGGMPKPHDLAFSSSLFRAASQLCIPPLTRPTYPSFGPPPNSFGGLAGLSLPGMGLFGSKDLGPGMLPADPWNRIHRTPPNFPSPSASSSSSWGGLKAEAERERERLQHRDEQDRQKKAAEKDKKEKEIEKSKEMLRDKREHDKQKERDRETRAYHTASNVDALHNGEFSDRGRERDRLWERPRERRENSRSPIRSVSSIPKTDSAFESSNSKSKQDIKVKEEKREKEAEQIEPGRESTELRTKSSESSSRPESQTSNINVCNIPERSHGLSSVNLGCISSSERNPMSHFWGSIPPTPVLATNAPSLNISEHYRSLELLREAEREQLMQKYGPALPTDRLREADLSRHSAASYEATDRQLQLERERQLYASGAKLIPPPLRNDMSTFVPPLGLTSTPPTSGLFPFSNSFLNSYCSGGLPPSNTKTMSPVNVGNGIPPPPLIPCGALENPSSSSAPNHAGTPGRNAASSTPPSHQKSGSERGSPPENYPTKDKRETNSQPRDAESQSR